MAAYAQQTQQQPPLQQQQFGRGSYPNSPPAANSYQGQHNQPQAGYPAWQAPSAQTANQAWEQSQLYDYQPVQARASGQQSQQPPTQQYQYAQLQQRQQQEEDSLVHRQPSFIGLPPIRRTSTLLSSVVKIGHDDNDSTIFAPLPHAGEAQQAQQARSSIQPVTQPRSANQAQTPRAMQGTPEQYQITGKYRLNQPGALPSTQNAMQQGVRNSPQPQQNYQQGSPGRHGRSVSGPVSPQRITLLHDAPRFSPQPELRDQSPTTHLFPAIMRHSTGAVSPNAGGPIRPPPLGTWKLEESHLQEPLLSPSRNRSPSNPATPTLQNQPYFGFDKETDLVAPASPPSPEPQVSHAAQQAPLNGQEQPQPGQVPRMAAADGLDNTDLPPPDPAQAAEDRQAKRSSGLFSNIRGRFSREGAEDRRGSAASPTGHSASDGISESNVPLEELPERRKRHSFFGGHAPSQLPQSTRQSAPNGAPAGSPLANAAMNSAERIENQRPASAYDQRMQQAAQPEQMPPSEKKKTFFGLPLGPAEQPPKPTRSDMSRASTSSNTTAQADAGSPSAGIDGGPKKRLSGLASKMFSLSTNSQNGQKPPESTQAARQSFSQGPPSEPRRFSGGFSGGFPGIRHGEEQVAGQPVAPSPTLAQQGYPAVQHQSPLQQSPQQQPEQFQPGLQLPWGQLPAQQHPAGHRSPSMASNRNPGSEVNGHRTPQGQQHPFPGQEQQQGQPWGQQQPGQHAPGQQQPRFQQHRLVQERPSQQSLSQQPQQFQQQPWQQGLGLIDPPQPLGRESSDIMSSRPFTPGGSRPNPMMAHSSSSSIGDEHHRRKRSGSGILSNIFGGHSGSKSRDPKPGQGLGQQAISPPQGRPEQPGHQQYFGQFPSQQPHQYAPSQQGTPSPLTQQQQQHARLMGAPGQFGPPEPGQQQPGQAQFMHQETPAPQQFARTRQVSGQQPPRGPGQQGQAQAGSPRPTMYPQLQSQQSQASIASASATLGQRQPGLVNGQRTPSNGQLYPTQQAQAREPVQRTSPGPLNQHPPLETSPRPPPKDTLRDDMVSPPTDDSISGGVPPGSPPLTSPLSQVSMMLPVERQRNDSPLSFRQPASPQQQQVGQTEPVRQLQTLAPKTSVQRKPVQSSPRPPRPSQASSVHEDSDHSKGSPSTSSAYIATATASPVDHSPRLSQQFGQHGPQQRSSPLTQQPQLANQHQPWHPSGQSPVPRPGVSPQAGYPGRNVQLGAQPGQAQGGASGQVPPNQRFTGQQQPNQPYPGPQPPWMAGRASTDGSGPGPQYRQQQAPGQYFQSHPQNSGHEKEPKGTISKLLNKAKEVTHTGPSQDKAEKEKSGKSRFGFLRSSKHPEQRQQQLRGGPQCQGRPGRPVMPQEFRTDRLQQLQSQVSPSEAQPRHSPTPSPGPHLNYQHQRQTPSRGNSPLLPPTAGSKTPSPGPQQVLYPAQAAPSSSQQQQNAYAVPQLGVPRPEHGWPGAGPALDAQGQGQFPGAGPALDAQGQGQFPGSGQTPTPANLRPATAPQKLIEPQYGEVPIPTGYGKVHSEGRVEPAPVAYDVGPHGQFLPVQTGMPGSQPHVQPWVQPGIAQGQPSYGRPQQQQQPRQGGHFQPQPTQQPVNRASVASIPASTRGFPAGGTHPRHPDRQHPLTVQNPDQPPPQRETPRAAPASGASSSGPDSRDQAYIAPADNALQSGPEPERLPTAIGKPSDAPSSPSPLQHPRSPQSYSLPESAFSPVNPAAGDMPTPPLPSPLPSSELVPSPLRPFGSQSQIAVPQQQVSAASQEPSLQPGSPQGPPPGAQFTVEGGGLVDAKSPSPQAPPSGNLRAEPPTLSHPAQTMHINVHKANEHDSEQEDIYGATPRTEIHPIQQPTRESAVSAPDDELAEPKGGGTSHEVLEHRETQEAPSPQGPQDLAIETDSSPSPSSPLSQPAPIHSSPAANTDAERTNDTRPASPTNNNPADIFEEARRRAVLRDMEEKIPVFPTEPDMEAQQLAQLAAKKKEEEEERPQMSATSYPGQEWNPYGEGWDDDE